MQATKLEQSEDRPTTPRDLRSFQHFDILLSIFVVVLLISNLVGQKIAAIGPFRISGAQLLFPITYIFGDIFTEVYGYAASRRAIWLGFFASALMAVMGMITVALPPAPGWENQEAFATVFNFVPRLVIASLIAYWAGEFANSYVLAKMKILTEGRHLWMRTIGSTIVGQLVDTTVLMVIAFAGSVSPRTIVILIFSGYLGKVLYEVVMTPVTYAVVNWLKRREGVDVFDRGTDFSPFHISK
jgi:queuosine precursor transporter